MSSDGHTDCIEQNLKQHSKDKKTYKLQKSRYNDLTETCHRISLKPPRGILQLFDSKALRPVGIMTAS